ncbi:uncharacterized protein ANIA_07888 [Aspergillus nidulans FGSC A4]|uniref:SMP-30/Gluconolactonase/LRE-like region domain-containing protein n=1 Tax=Emericella nidulans (strain FGSC A4 / ATCC 38163 / CBS 112.46 / NRRL 194 / M139) TaxID=227321 RepID=C8V4I6_EMENI|nr:hypothetical protein [Aspergillus nidulans FGSC A4]CBF73461.1 TPA: conserved hypothetical protein [Aspergillus nidulans FGSC A4]
MLAYEFLAFFLIIGCLAQPPISSLKGRGTSGIEPSTVSQFPLGTWAENIAVRQNGNLLVTLLTAPEVHEIIPSNSFSSARLAFAFEGHSNVTGITEVKADVFVVCVDGGSLWELNFREGDTPHGSLLTRIPEAQLNGLATLNPANGIVIAADSTNGCIWRVDVKTRAYESVLKDETMQPVPVNDVQLGINGLQVFGNTAYYTNTPKNLFCRVQLHPVSGRPTSPVDIISDSVEADDFAITPAGIAYLANTYQNKITKFSWRNSEVIAGSLNSSSIPNPTSAIFGRTAKDRNVLYVTTGGGEAGPINGTFVEGGAVLSLRLW